MGLRDWLRGKREEDPILGGLGRTGSSLQPQPAPMRQTPQMQAGDQMFPGASIDVSDSMVQGMFDPQQAAMMGIGTLQAQPAPAQSDPVDRLERLASLRDSGAITDDEFSAAKARLLGS